MKKILISMTLCTVAILLAVTGILVAILTPTPTKPVQASSTTQVTQTAVQMSNFQNIEPVTIRTSTITTTSWQPDGASNPAEKKQNPIYTQNRQRIYMSKETGLLVTRDGRPIMDGRNSSITTFDMETQEFANGAHQRLSIYFNSFLNRHYLRAGGGYVTEINMNREIFLINIRTRDGTMAIYTFRERVNHGWSIIYRPGAWFNNEYRYFDMNGRLIENRYIQEWDTATFARAMTGNVIFFAVTGGIGFFAQLLFGSPSNFGVPFVRILDRTTLANLLEEISKITVHPYPYIYGVVTEDGMPIFIRPSTMQLVDRFNFPLFSFNTGLPAIVHDSIIVDTRLQAMEVRNGVLRGVVSVWQLLYSGTDFFMGTIATPFGNKDAVVFNLSNDVNNPNWVLPNGDNADGIIRDMEMGRSLDGESWSDLFSRLGSGNLMAWVWTIIFIILLIFCFPLVIALLKALLTILIAPFRWLAKKAGAV